MPFTIDGNWVPHPSTPKHSGKSVKVRLIKKGKNILTVILNLPISSKELSELASNLKKKLGCGGAIHEDAIELQGDKVIQVKQILKQSGIESS